MGHPSQFLVLLPIVSSMTDNFFLDNTRSRAYVKSLVHDTLSRIKILSDDSCTTSYFVWSVVSHEHPKVTVHQVFVRCG